MRPVNRCQSPISTASPNAVSVDNPRKHPSRVHHRGELAVGGQLARSRHRGGRVDPAVASIVSKAVS